MAGDIPRKPACEIVSINADFSSSSPDPLGLRRPSQAGVKDGYPPKK